MWDTGGQPRLWSLPMEPQELLLESPWELPGGRG